MGVNDACAESAPVWNEKPPSDVEKQALLASGSGADVFKGILQVNDVVQEVAVRRPRITSAAALDRFENEVRLRAGLDHAHVLPLISACTQPPTFCTVSPWMAGGDLFDAMHSRGTRFNFVRTLRLCTQLAKAMAYLHEKKLVHRDLKTANVLLDGSLVNAYVSDLDLAISVEALLQQASVANGRAMHRGPSNGRLSHMVGTLVYLAPEVLLGAPHTFAADVYAFAVTANEIASATVPYIDRELPVPELHTVLESRFNDVTLRRAITKDHLRPVLANNVPSGFAELITTAWAAEPESRPTFKDIVFQLEALVAKGEEYNGQYPAAAGASHSPGANSKIDAGGRPADSYVVNVELASIRQANSPPLPSWSVDGLWVQKVGATVPAYLPTVSGAVSSTCGGRGEDRMEDTAIVQQCMAGVPHAHFFAVFDGHGGDACSRYVADFMPAAIFRRWALPDADPVSVLVHAFQDIDGAFLESTPASEQSGCTALGALFLGSKLFVANAGDCRCVIGRTDGATVVVTKDHIATDPAERAKVEARGGRVDPKTGRIQGRLMVSRAIGDRAVKQFVPATPDVFTIDLDAEHDFMVLASDGLWDVVSSEEAVALVRSTARSADLAAKRLALKAIELGSDDNISVICVHLDAASSSTTAI
jgi:protein phosphatase 1L